MNYEQKYKEALERAKTLYENANGMILKKWVEQVFPELCESEDERIRYEILAYIGSEQDIDLDTYNKWCSWLEKQDPKKHEEELEKAYKCADEVQYRKGYEDAMREIEKQGEQKLSDKVEPKFKVGDKIQYLKGCGTIMTIEKIENGEYIFGNNLGHTTIESGNKWHLVNLMEQTSTWSEEDERIYNSILNDLRQNVIPDEEDIDWFKSLKDRYTWKPSDEQMADLWNMLCGRRPVDHQLLKDIYYGLKKMMNSYERDFRNA